MSSANGKDNKKWDDTAEKDLAMAIILSQNDGKIKADWNQVHESMNNWGYSFTKDAMNQHWSKKVLKSFKERHNMSASGDPSTPVKTPRKGNGKGSAKKIKEDVKEEDEAIEDETPTKKRKRAPKAEAVKTGQTEDAGDAEE